MADSKPAAMAAAAPAEMPSARQSASSKLPRPEPMVCWFGTTVLGTKAASSSSQRSLPCRWECRCTSGLQPPETASRSQAISSTPEVSSPSSLMLRTVTPSSAAVCRPADAVLATALPISTRVPASTAAAATAVSCGTGVDDGGDLDAGGAQVRGQGVGAVVGGADDHALPGGHGVAVEVAADGRGEHDAGAVVVLEHQRAFVGAGGQDHLVGTDVPNPLPGHAGGGRAGQVVGAVLDGDDVVGVVGAEGGGAVQDGGFGAGDEFGFDVRHPFQGRLAFDGLGQPGGGGAGQERAAQFGLVVHAA